MDKPKVFISHSTLDADWARSFAQALQQRGLTVWFDEFDVHPGESLPDALESGLRGSDTFVALLDAEHPATPAFFFELGAAIGMGKRVVPIVPKGLDQSNIPLEELSNALLAA